MGTSASAAQLASKLQRAAKAIPDASAAGVNRVALEGKAIFLANMGTRRIRNLGKNGAKVGARYTAAKSEVNPTALLFYTGPAHILNNPTKAHPIYPRGARVRDEGGAITKRRRSGGAKGLTLPGDNVRLYVNHPGTSGKRFFEKSVPQVARAQGRQHRAAIGAELRKIF